MNPRSVLIILFTLITCLPASSQSVDSLLNAYAEVKDQHHKAELAFDLGEYFFYINPDSAEYFFQIARDLVHNTDDDSLYVRVYERSSILSETATKNQPALQQIRMAHARVINSGMTEQVEQMYTLLGRYHFRSLNYDSAIYYWNLLIESKDRKGNEYGKWLPCHYLAALYADLGDWSKGKEYYQQALEYARLEKRPKDYPYLLYRYMKECEMRGDMDLFSDLRNEYLTFKQERGYNILTPEHSTLYVGDVKPEERRKTLLEYLPYHLKNKNDLSACETYFQIGQSYLMEKNYPEALRNYQKMLPFTEALKLPTLTYNVHSALFTTYDESGDYRNALDHHKVMIVMRDSVMNIDRQKQMNELTVKFETAEKEKQLAETTLNLSTSKKKQQLLGIGLVGALVISVLSFYAFRTKMKSNEQLKEKNRQITKTLAEKDILLREIHHRVKNNLQMISALLYLHGKSVDDSSAQEALKESQNRVQSMAILHQNLYQNDNLLGVSVQAYLDKLVNHLIDSYNIEKDRIMITKKIDISHLDVDMVIPLALIINELISNSLKYAFNDGRKGIIDVSLGQINNQIELEVKDNGMGISSKGKMEANGNFGYKLINILSERLGASWKTTSADGTIVSLSIPLKKAA